MEPTIESEKMFGMRVSNRAKTNLSNSTDSSVGKIIELYNNCEKPDYEDIIEELDKPESEEEIKIVEYLNKIGVFKYNMDERKYLYFENRKQKLFNQNFKIDLNPSNLSKKRSFKHSLTISLGEEKKK